MAAKYKTYTGTVISVNPNERLLDVRGWILNKKFHLGDNCGYALLDNPSGAITDLRSGEKVTVSYQNANGVLVADRVKQKPMSYEGTVKSIDPAAHTLTLRSHLRDETFQLPDNCQVTLRDNKSGALTDVQPGNYVTVTYETPNNTLVAHQIAQTSEEFTGELTAVNMNNRTLEAKALFGTKKFDMADHCAIVLNDKLGGKLTDLKLGEKLEFNYDDVNGINVVNRIATTTEPSQPEVTTTQSIPATP